MAKKGKKEDFEHKAAKKIYKKVFQTTVIVKYDVGFPNQLTIRGEGAGLSWDKGLPLINIAPDCWVWKTYEKFEECQFKVLINDFAYEMGENHYLIAGQELSFVPKFS